MTKDSFDHLREARAGVYSDAHPPIINVIWKFLEVFVAGQFGMLVLQSGLLLAGLYAMFRATFTARRAAWWAAGVFVFPPVLTVMAVIWKDCSMAGLLAVGIACLLSSRRGVRITGLAALCSATALRYNAFGATLPIVVLLFEWRPGMRWLRRYALSTAAWLVVTVAAFGLNAALTDKPMHYWHSSLAVYDIVGTLAFVDEDLSDAELRAELAGTELLIDHDLHATIRTIYSPRDFLAISRDPARTLWNLPLNGYVPAPRSQRDAIGRAWWHTVTSHPWAYARHRLSVTGELLDLGSHHALGAVPKRDLSLPAYAVELGLATGWSTTQLELTDGMHWLSRHTPLFVPWVYLVLTLVLLPLAWRQRDVLAILLSGLVMESSLLFLAHSRDYRYSHWMVITTTIGSIVLATRRYRAARPQAIVAVGLVGLLGLLGLLGMCACHGKPEHKDFGPRFFSGASRVQCSKGLDRDHEWKHEALAASLERARDQGVVLHTFGHAPKLDLGEYVADFDWAAANGVPMVTFRELAAGRTGAGWAFTVDDDEVDTWYSWRDQLRAHHVKVTFFVTRYDRFTAAQKQELHELAADGHDIEAHGKAHENAVAYVAAHGLDGYLRDEVRPSKDVLVADGYAPVAFAYPYGAHTAAIDGALMQELALVRTTGGEWCLK